MDEPSAKSASEFKVHAMMVNGKSSPGRALPAMADPASLVGPMHHDRFRSTEDTKHHLVESGPTRQSMRKRQSPRSSGTESDMCTPRNADLADCNGDRDSNAVLPDETDENGGPSPQSSRKRRSTTRAAKFLEMDVASIPFVAASDHAPSASKKSSLRHTMDTTNNAVENWEGSVTAGSTRQSTRSRMPRITYESEFNAIASSKVSFFLFVVVNLSTRTYSTIEYSYCRKTRQRTMRPSSKRKLKSKMRYIRLMLLPHLSPCWIQGDITGRFYVIVVSFCVELCNHLPYLGCTRARRFQEIQPSTLTI